jgi:hypothetical protein
MILIKIASGTRGTPSDTLLSKPQKQSFPAALKKGD